MRRGSVVAAIGVTLALAISGLTWASNDAAPVVIAKNDKDKGPDWKKPHHPHHPSSTSGPSSPRPPHRPTSRPSSGPHSGPHDNDRCKRELDAAHARIEALKAELEACRRGRH